MDKATTIFPLRIVLALMAVLTLSACHDESSSYQTGAHDKDSLYTYKNIVKIHMEQPELALARIDTAQDRRLVSKDSCTLLRVVVLGASDKRKEAEDMAEDYLETSKADSLQPLYLWIKKCLIDDYMLDAKYDKSLAHALQGIRWAHEARNLKIEAELNFSAGNCMIRLDNMRGFDYFDQAIEALESRGGDETLPALSAYIGQKARQLANHEKYEEAAKECEHRLAVIDKLSQLSGMPDGYVDGQRGKTLCVEAYCQAKAGKKAEAQATAEAFYKTGYSKTPDGYDDILSYEYEMKHGERLIAICSKLYPLYFGQDTINTNVTDFLGSYANGYRMTGNYEEADKLMRRISVITDSLHLRQQRAESLELSEKYHTQEKEYALATERLNLKISRMVIIGLSVILLIVAAALFMVRQYNKLIRAKNRILVRHINEITSQPYGRPIKADIGAVKEDLNKGKNDDTALHDKYTRLEKMMLEEELFKRVDFGRDDILQLLNINRNQLAQIFTDYAEGVTSPVYINNHRLRLACQMIRTDKDISIQIVASECGFSTTRNFNRAFKQKYAITPLEYKNGLE